MFTVFVAEMSLVICDKLVKVKSLLQDADSMPTLKVLVVMEDVTKEISEMAANHNVQLLTLTEAEASRAVLEISYIVIHTGLLVAKIKSCIPRAL